MRRMMPAGAWLNLVKVWFGIIDKEAIRRGVFGSVKDFNAKIRVFIDGWTLGKPVDRRHLHALNPLAPPQLEIPAPTTTSPSQLIHTRSRSG